MAVLAGQRDPFVPRSNPSGHRGVTCGSPRKPAGSSVTSSLTPPPAENSTPSPSDGVSLSTICAPWLKGWPPAWSDSSGGSGGTASSRQGCLAVPDSRSRMLTLKQWTPNGTGSAISVSPSPGVVVLLARLPPLTVATFCDGLAALDVTCVCSSSGGRCSPGSTSP